MARDFRPFTTWAELVDHIKAEYSLWYQGPMDARPVQVNAIIRRKDGAIRVMPIWGDADPFTADEGHLSRFRQVE